MRASSGSVVCRPRPSASNAVAPVDDEGSEQRRDGQGEQRPGSREPTQFVRHDPRRRDERVARTRQGFVCAGLVGLDWRRSRRWLGLPVPAGVIEVDLLERNFYGREAVHLATRFDELPHHVARLHAAACERDAQPTNRSIGHGCAGPLEYARRRCVVVCFEVVCVSRVVE